MLGKYCLVNECIYKVGIWYVFRTLDSVSFSASPVASAFAFLIPHHSHLGLLTACFGACPFKPTSSLLRPLPSPPPTAHALSVCHIPQQSGCGCGLLWEHKQNLKSGLSILSPVAMWNLSELVITLLGFNQNKKYQIFLFWINLYFFILPPLLHTIA